MFFFFVFKSVSLFVLVGFSLPFSQPKKKKQLLLSTTSQKKTKKKKNYVRTSNIFFYSGFCFCYVVWYTSLRQRTPLLTSVTTMHHCGENFLQCVCVFDEIKEKNNDVVSFAFFPVQFGLLLHPHRPNFFFNPTYFSTHKFYLKATRHPNNFSINFA